MTDLLWTLQGLLALLFLFTGRMKPRLAPHRGSSRPSLRQPSTSRG